MPDEIIVRRWAIVRSPRHIPEVKTPLRQTTEALVVLLRELLKLYPDAVIVAAELTWDQQLWVTDAREMVMVYDSLHRRRRRAA